MGLYSLKLFSWLRFLSILPLWPPQKKIGEDHAKHLLVLDLLEGLVSLVVHLHFRLSAAYLGLLDAHEPTFEDLPTPPF